MTVLNHCVLLFLVNVFITNNVYSYSTISGDTSEVVTSTVNTTDDESNVQVQDSPIVDRRGSPDDVHTKLVNEIAQLQFAARKKSHHFTAPHTSDFGTHNLVKVAPLVHAAVCPDSVEIQAITFYGHLVTVCIHSSRRSISLARFDNHSKQWYHLPYKFSAKHARKVALFADISFLYILIADMEEEMGIDLIRINREFHLMPKEHTINSHFTTSVAVWKSSAGNKWRLAIANSVNPRDRTNLRSFTNIYTWEHTYFDLVDEIPAFYVKDLCPFVIYGMEYMAVINQRAGEHNFNVDSQILRFDIDTNKWKVVQSIRTFAASDAEHFSLGPVNTIEHFLVIANEYNVQGDHINYNTDSIIYKFSVDKFLPFQCLRTRGASQVTTFKGEGDKFLLLIATRDGVKMYQYNGWRFTESNLSLRPPIIGPGVTSISTAHIHGKDLVLVSYSRKNLEPNVFELVFDFDNPLGKWYDRSVKWCDGMIRNHSVQDPALEHNLKHVFFVNQRSPIHIHGVMEFEDFSSDHLKAPRILDQNLHLEYNYEIIKTLEDIERELRELQIQLDLSNQELELALKLFGNQRVFAPFSVKEAVLCTENDSCVIGAANARWLNGIRDFGRGVLRTDFDQIIPNNFKFHSVVANRDVFVNGLVDGIITSSIVTSNENHFFKHPIRVNSISTHLATVGGLVNGHPLTTNHVLLTRGNQVVESELIFRHPLVVQNLHLNLVGQQPHQRRFQDLMSGIVTNDGIHRIIGHKVLDLVRSNTLHQLPMSTINQVDLQNQWDNLLWTHGNQKLTSCPLFTNVIVNGDIVVEGKTNKIRLPGPNVVTTRQNFAFNGRKVFMKPSFVHSADIRKSLNGLPTKDGELNILLKTRPQTIYAPKKFRVIRLGGISNVMGNIQGIKLAKLLERTLWKNVTHRFGGRFEIEGDVRFLNGIHVVGKVAQIDLNRLYDPRRTMFLSERYFPPIIQPEFKWFQTKFVNTRIINGLEIGRDLLTRTTKQRIVVPVTFTERIDVQKSIHIETINDVHLTDIRNSLFMEGQQKFSEDMVIDGNLFVGGVGVKSLNDVSMNDLVYLNSPKVMQEIYATKQFENMVALKDVGAKQVEGVVMINGLHFRDLIDNTLRYNDHQVITGKKSFGSIVVPPNHHIDVRRVNNVDLRGLQSNAVMKNSPKMQEISGKVIFRNRVAADDFVFTSLFDGVSMAEILNSWVIQGVPQKIVGNLIIANDVSVHGNLVAKGGLNGVDLAKLNDNVVKVNTPSIIVGACQFLNTSVINGDTFAYGKIGGIDLKDAVKKYSARHQVVYGPQTFMRNMKAKAISGSGWFNGISIQDLCSNSVRKYGTQIIRAPVVLDGDARFPSLIVKRDINNLNLMRLRNEMAFRNHPDIAIRGEKHFKSLEIVGPAQITGMLNGINWNLLALNYMSLTRNQQIKSPLEFAAPVTSTKPMFIAGNFYTANGVINKVNLFDLSERTMRSYGDQRLESAYVFKNVRFEKNVYLATDLINGVNLHKDLLMKRGRNVVSVPKIIGNVLVRGNMVAKTINEVDFSKLVHATVYRQGVQLMTGRKRFRHLEAPFIASRGPLSHIWFTRRNIFHRNSNQKLIGPTHFVNGFHIDGNLSVAGLINGLNVEGLRELLVMKGRENIVHHLISIAAPVRVTKEVVVKGRINDLNIDDMIKSIDHEIDFGSIPSRIESVKPKFEWLRKNADYLAHQINYFNVAHHLKYERVVEMSRKELGSNFFYFAAMNERMDCESIAVKHFTKDRHILQQNLKSFRPFKVVEFFHRGILHIVVVNKRHIESNHLMSCLSPTHLKPIGSGNSLIQVFVFQQHTQHFAPMSSLLFEELSDINLLSNTPSSVCFTLIARMTERVFVTCLHNGILTAPQPHPLHSIGKISTIQSAMNRMTVMAAFSSKSRCRETFKVNLFRWLPSQKFNSIQTVTAVNPKLVYFVESTKELPSSFLFIGEGRASFLGNEPLLRVFRFSPGFKYPFTETQQLRVDFISMDSIYMPDGHLLVFILNRDESINVYQLKGASGFQMVDSIRSNSADTFTAKVTEAGLQIALSDQENANVLCAVTKG